MTQQSTAGLYRAILGQWCIAKVPYPKRTEPARGKLRRQRRTDDGAERPGDVVPLAGAMIELGISPSEVRFQGPYIIDGPKII